MFFRIFYLIILNVLLKILKNLIAFKMFILFWFWSNEFFNLEYLWIKMILYFVQFSVYYQIIFHLNQHTVS